MGKTPVVVQKEVPGFIANRFTGRYAWTAGAEYRFWAIPRGVRVS